MDQRALVERAQGGDHEAFETLARSAVVRLDVAARLIIRDGDLAQDAVQDALFRAWRDLRGLRDPVRFDAWLYRLTVNACLDVVRRRRHRPVEVDLTSIAEPMIVDALGDVADREIVDVAMRRLAADARSVVVLHYYLGLPLSEVADALRIPVGTAKSRLSRALAQMRSSIEEGDRSVAAPVAGRELA